MLEINGSYHEGGGQIIRTAIALSSITGKPCRIINIRANRSQPGLKAQHLKGVEAAAEMCQAELKGAKIHSTELEYRPIEPQKGNYKVDVGTAGSVTLVLQTLMPLLLKTGSSVTIKGGTNVAWSPTVGYFQNIFLHLFDAVFNIKKYGFYPKGGGIVECLCKPTKFQPINITKRIGKPEITIESIASTSLRNREVAERQLPEKGSAKYVNSDCPGSCIDAYIKYDNTVLGVNVLGERNKSAESVGREIKTKINKILTGTFAVDEHLADQLIPYMALAGQGKITAPVSKHTETNIWVVEKFLDVKFKIKGNMIGCGN
jgi:RNA 3'-terminal phosphate cyclase (ATP)